MGSPDSFPGALRTATCLAKKILKIFADFRGYIFKIFRKIGTERGSYNAPKNYDCGTRETPAPHPSRISKHQKNVPALVRFNFHFFPLVLCCVLRFLRGAGCVVGRNALVRCSFHYRCAFFLLKCGFSRLRNCAICGFGHCAKIFKIRVTTPFEEFAP